MDVLSEVLKAVTLEGALFYNAEFSAPWGVRSPESTKVAPYVAPQGGHVIIFHLLTDGRGSARLENGESVTLEAGDIVVLPHGDAHILENGSPRTRHDNEKELQRIFSEGLKLSRYGGGGELTKLVCGYMVCDPRISRMVLRGLPSIFKVSIRDDDTGRFIESSLRFSVDGADGNGPGGGAVLAKLSELLFVETLRRYVAQHPEGRTGWLAGARDPEVGKALALIHGRPAHPWTLADLAKESGISRSVLAERFRHFLNQPPMAYLTGWRLQCGARLLATTSRSVSDIAAEVGYESEAAFNRAFKREFGLP
ncbi:MAG TPA: AraC family transcriptional regulator, partial [Candidatus Polarisedimenticolia bacterium]|nr:AraC family transcriptional regulator [Candidatus Polarisedimenticolia bacterium]